MVINDDGTVTLTREELDELESDQHFLRCLEGAGVDNWDGYESAQEAFAQETLEAK